jgi:hypothetical protein
MGVEYIMDTANADVCHINREDSVDLLLSPVIDSSGLSF